MTQDAPRPIHVQKVDAVSNGIAQPLLTPSANLSGIYKNLRVAGATTEYKLYDLLLQRMEEGKPVDWRSVSEEVTVELKANQSWYKAVLIRMLEKNWIDVPKPASPEQAQNGTPLQQHNKRPQINALAEDFIYGISEAAISDEQRTSWRANLTTIPDLALLPACVWYMGQLEHDDPHSLDDWIHFVATQQEFSKNDEMKERKDLLDAIDYLEMHHFIVEISPTPLMGDDIDFDEMADEIGMIIDTGEGKKRLMVMNADQLAEKIAQYAQESDPRKKDARAIQHELLQRVRDGESTAWEDVYAAVKDRLSDTMNKGKAQQVYLDAVDLSMRRGMICVEE